MHVIGYNIRKNLKNWLKEKSKNVDVRSRNVIIHHFGHNVTCSQKIGFTCLWNRNYMQKSEKINVETLRKLKLQPYTVMLSPIQNYPLSPIFKAVFSQTSQFWKRYKRGFKLWSDGTELKDPWIICNVTLQLRKYHLLSQISSFSLKFTGKSFMQSMNSAIFMTVA